MAKVPQSARSAGKPQLKPDVTGGADVCVVTITGTRFVENQFQKGAQQVVCDLKEYPEHSFRVNKTGTDALVKKFGDDCDDWKDQRIPLVKSRAQVGNQTHTVYQVAPLDEWASIFKAEKKSRK